MNSPVSDQQNIHEPLQLQTNVNREHLNEDTDEQDDPLNEHRSAATVFSPSCQIILLTWSIQTVIIQQVEKFSTLHKAKVNTQYH